LSELVSGKEGKNKNPFSEFPLDGKYRPTLRTYEIKKVLIAGLSSILFPGLGQIYNGQLKKGILFIFIPYIFYLLLLILVSFFLLVFILMLGLPVISLICFPVFWIINVYDAVINSNKIIIGSRFWDENHPIRYVLIILGISITIVFWYFQLIAMLVMGKIDFFWHMYWY
jgi:hypothetical protein